MAERKGKKRAMDLPDDDENDQQSSDEQQQPTRQGPQPTQGQLRQNIVWGGHQTQPNTIVNNYHGAVYQNIFERGSIPWAGYERQYMGRIDELEARLHNDPNLPPPRPPGVPSNSTHIRRDSARPAASAEGAAGSGAAGAGAANRTEGAAGVPPGDSTGHRPATNRNRPDAASDYQYASTGGAAHAPARSRPANPAPTNSAAGNGSFAQEMMRRNALHPPSRERRRVPAEDRVAETPPVSSLPPTTRRKSSHIGDPESSAAGRFSNEPYREPTPAEDKLEKLPKRSTGGSSSVVDGSVAKHKNGARYFITSKGQEVKLKYEVEEQEIAALTRQERRTTRSSAIVPPAALSAAQAAQAATPGQTLSTRPAQARGRQESALGGSSQPTGTPAGGVKRQSKAAKMHRHPDDDDDDDPDDVGDGNGNISEADESEAEDDAGMPSSKRRRQKSGPKMKKVAAEKAVHLGKKMRNDSKISSGEEYDGIEDSDQPDLYAEDPGLQAAIEESLLATARGRDNAASASADRDQGAPDGHEAFMRRAEANVDRTRTAHIEHHLKKDAERAKNEKAERLERARAAGYHHTGSDNMPPPLAPNFPKLGHPDANGRFSTSNSKQTPSAASSSAQRPPLNPISGNIGSSSHDRRVSFNTGPQTSHSPTMVPPGRNARPSASSIRRESTFRDENGDYPADADKPETMAGEGELDRTRYDDDPSMVPTDNGEVPAGEYNFSPQQPTAANAGQKRAPDDEDESAGDEPEKKKAKTPAATDEDSVMSEVEEYDPPDSPTANPSNGPAQSAGAEADNPIAVDSDNDELSELSSQEEEEADPDSEGDSDEDDEDDSAENAGPPQPTAIPPPSQRARHDGRPAKNLKSLNAYRQ